MSSKVFSIIENKYALKKKFSVLIACTGADLCVEGRLLRCYDRIRNFRVCKEVVIEYE